MRLSAQRAAGLQPSFPAQVGTAAKGWGCWKGAGGDPGIFGVSSGDEAKGSAEHGAPTHPTFLGDTQCGGLISHLLPFSEQNL